MANNRPRTTSQILQARIQRFSRVEKALQVQRDLTTVNSKIEAKRTELDDAKQEVNELIRSERLSKLASSQEMTQNNENIRTAE